MKRKDKKKKAQAFLRKYQFGGFNTDDTIMQNPYDFAPDLQTAKQQQLVQFNAPKNQQAYVMPSKNTMQGWDTAIPLISPAINLGIGIKNIIDSFGERKRQKQYERAYRKDLERRMEEARANDFYITPYGVPGTNYGSYEEGGSFPDKYKEMGFSKVDTPKRTPDASKSHAVVVKIDDDYKLIRFGQQGVSGSPKKDGESESDRKRRESFKARHRENINKGKSSAAYWADKVKWQQGGLYNPKQSNQFDFFLDFYNQKENEKQLKQQAFENYYIQNNERMEGAWRNKQNSGIQSALSGAFGIAKTFVGVPGFEDGGEYNPKKDLYSPEYDPNVFLEIENELSAAQIEDKEASAIEQWLFQDEPELDEVILNYFDDSDDSDGSYSKQTTTSNNSSLDVISNIEALESGGNPEAVNPITNATGLFQFVPKYWAGQIKSYMGLPQTFTQEQVMEAFKKNEKVQREFMDYVVNNIYMPEVEKLRPLAKQYNLSDDKIIKLLHYRGISDAKKRLRTGDFTISAEEKSKYGNPDILTYLNK